MKNLILILAFTLLSVIFSSFIAHQDIKPWEVPDSAKKMENPVDVDKETLAIGKNLYTKHCKSCHGKGGEGDGSKAGELETFPGDFTEAKFQSQKDGEMFYKTKEGRDDMPSFKKKIRDDEDYWILVNYLRTLVAN